MAFPVGVSVAIIEAGRAFTSVGSDVSMSAKVTPIFRAVGGGAMKRIVHAATGHPMLASTEEFKAEAGSVLSFAVPHVDQPGWQAPSGEAYTMWYYAVEITARVGNGRNSTGHVWKQNVQPLVGQDFIDLDLIADGPTGEPIAAPQAVVTSVDGQTGAVTLGPIVGTAIDQAVLEGRIPHPIVTESAPGVYEIGEGGQVYGLTPNGDLPANTIGGLDLRYAEISAPGDAEAAAIAHADALDTAARTEWGNADTAIRADLTPSKGTRPIGKGELFFNPLDYGAVGDGNPANAAADLAGWRAAHDAAVAAGAGQARGTLYVPHGEFVFADTFLWNAYVPIRGHARITSAITTPGKQLLRVKSYYNGGVASPVEQRAVVIEGIILQGNGISDGVTFDGLDGNDKPAHLTMRNCVVRGFNVGMYFGFNSYMQSFHACNIQGNKVGIQHLGEGNSGERLVFLDCDITGNDLAFELSSGQAFHFIACSFSYNLRQLGKVTTGMVLFEQCHMEFAEPMMDYLALSGIGAYALFEGCRWLVGPRRVFQSAAGTSAVGADGYITPTTTHILRDGDPVRVESSTAPGLANGVYYARDTTDTTRFRVAAAPGGAAVVPTGAGTVKAFYDGTYPLVRAVERSSRVAFRGGHFHGTSTMPYITMGAGMVTADGTQTFQDSAYRAHLSNTNYALMDGTMEATTIQDDWVVSQGTPTVAKDTGVFRAGARSLVITNPTKGAAADVDLFIPIDGGDRVLTSFWWRLAVTGSAYAVSWHFANRKRVVGVAQASTTRSFTNTDWAQLVQPFNLYRAAPPWAEYMVVRFTVSSVESGSTLHLDDFEASRF